MGEVAVVIPARWASSRYPGKVLATLGGKPLVLHACELARRAGRVQDVLVATDDPRVAQTVERAGFQVRMTSADHPSGTDRVAEVARELEARIVIGLQADEPFLAPEDIDALADAVGGQAPAPELATLASPLDRREDWLDPNVVKVVSNARDEALYFSRSPIPYQRPEAGPLPTAESARLPSACRVHVGVYGWQKQALLRFSSLPRTTLECSEGLEQLRALENGWRIALRTTRGTAFGIDTPADLERAERLLARRLANPQDLT